MKTQAQFKKIVSDYCRERQVRWLEWRADGHKVLRVYLFEEKFAQVYLTFQQGEVQVSVRENSDFYISHDWQSSELDALMVALNNASVIRWEVEGGA